MERIVKTCCLLVLFFLLLTTTKGYSIWQGPEEIIVGTWGKKDENFGLRKGDIQDTIPLITGILLDESIILTDEVNRRDVVYDKKGHLVKVVPWYIHKGDEKIDNPEYEKYKFWNIQGFTSEGNVWYRSGGKYLLKSLTDGKIIKSYDKRPPELGVVNKRKIGKRKFNTTITYPDRTYEFQQAIPFNEFYRDNIKNIIWRKTIVGKDVKGVNFQVYRSDPCTKEIVIFTMPQSEFEPMFKEGEQVDPYFSDMYIPIIVYGAPWISHDGALYCSARTKEEFKILKWTWESDSDAPQHLLVSNTDNVLKISWDAPLVDRENITEYEIYRLTDVCGPFKVIGKVKKTSLEYLDKDVKVGETYYYKVRAVKDKNETGYSRKVIGRITK
ncbi:MAG: fibronectin type III domain-containing protein [bacterium]